VGKAARVTGVLSFMPKMIRGPNSVKRAPITLGPAGYRAGRVRSDDAPEDVPDLSDEATPERSPNSA
jgi:hypothetical protein